MFLEYLLHERGVRRRRAPRLRRGARRVRPELLRAVRAGGGAPDAGERGALVVAPDGEAATRLAADLGALPRPRRCRCCPRAACCTAPTWRRRRTWWASASRRWPRSPPAASSSPRPWPCSSASCRSSCSRGRSRWRPATRSPSTPPSPRLAALGYERVEQVRGRGEFAVRGGLIDAYPALGDPLRVEFWGDEVETVRTFSVYSQRTTGTLDEATVCTRPSRPTPACPSTRPACTRPSPPGSARAARRRRTSSYRRAGVRALAALAGRFTTLAELVGGDGAACGRVQPGRDLPSARRLRRRGRDGGATGAGLRERLYVPLADARALLAGALHLDLVQRDQPLQFAASRPQFAARDLAGAERDLVAPRQRRLPRVRRLPPRGRGRARHLPPAQPLGRGRARREQLARGGEAGPGPLLPRRAAARGLRRRGPQARRRQRARAAARRAARAALRRPARGSPPSSTCAPATTWSTRTTASRRFAGIETRTVAGVTRDYLLLEFRGDDRVFVPHDQIGKVSRYVGAVAARRRRSTSWAAPTGRRSRPGRARPSSRWPASCCSSTRPPGRSPASPFRPTAS